MEHNFSLFVKTYIMNMDRYAVINFIDHGMCRKGSFTTSNELPVFYTWRSQLLVSNRLDHGDGDRWIAA